MLILGEFFIKLLLRFLQFKDHRHRLNIAPTVLDFTICGQSRALELCKVRPPICYSFSFISSMVALLDQQVIRFEDGLLDCIWPGVVHLHLREVQTMKQMIIILLEDQKVILL